MESTMVLITGNTYPHREYFRGIGGKWDSFAKGWLVPADKAEEARKLASEKRGRRRYGSTYARFSSGFESYQNRNGRCEDAPCCGCCS